MQGEIFRLLFFSIKPLQTAENIYSHREGLWLNIKCEDYSGWGFEPSSKTTRWLWVGDGDVASEYFGTEILYFLLRI